MSAAIFLQQRDAAYLLTDAAAYYSDGVIDSFGDKCTPIDEAHCAITVLGSDLQAVIADAIGASFTGYDETKAGIGALARRLFDRHVDAIGLDMKAAELWVVGYSQAQQRVEGFTLTMVSDAEWEIWAQRSPGVELERFPFVPDVQRFSLTANPAPTGEELFVAQFPRCDTEQLDPEIDLLHLMEVLRRHRFVHAAWPHLVGGWATLTTIDAGGITQRRIHEWPEDCVGATITPQPIDWSRWRAARTKPVSRLKADMLARRAAKAQRRLAG